MSCRNIYDILFLLFCCKTYNGPFDIDTFSELDAGDLDDFVTPPDSPDDVLLPLSDEIKKELDALEETEGYIKKNQESIAKSAGKNRLKMK